MINFNANYRKKSNMENGSAQNAICSKIHKNKRDKCTRSIRISDSFAVCFSRVSIQPSEDIKSIDTMSLLNGVYIGRDLMEIYF